MSRDEISSECGKTLLDCLRELEADRPVNPMDYFDVGVDHTLDRLRSIMLGHGIPCIPDPKETTAHKEIL